MGKLKKYKMKTHSGAKARFWITGTGKIMRRKIGSNNFRRKKRGETLRQMSGKLEVSPHSVKRLKKMLPYA
ncbi:MAG: 50S ribosomal protein L35 [Dehalococcoidia bacterium]